MVGILVAQNQNAEEKRRYNTVAADDRLYAILNTNKNRTTVGTGLKADGTVWVEISRDDKIVHQFELNAEE